MTHDELVERAARWLRNGARCVFVLTELSRTGESPDAIGWLANGHSLLIECKANKPDFYRDRQKPPRRHADLAIGSSRFYLTPAGMLAPKLIPEGWGLLECTPRTVRLVVSTPRVTRDVGVAREMTLLLNAVRRCYSDPKVSSSMRPVRHIEPEPAE